MDHEARRDQAQYRDMVASNLTPHPCTFRTIGADLDLLFQESFRKSWAYLYYTMDSTMRVYYYEFVPF